ncbi:ImuA family protein [Roseixanthobacter liquoris]|uniref:ImuA family protein n=1 Tax=Roseixanthobacter liquoris TaxID=3119921 RepID=UPI00372AC36B
MSNPSATRAAGELARLRRCISAIERRVDAPPTRPPVPWSAGEAVEWDEEAQSQEIRSQEIGNQEIWNQEIWSQEIWSQGNWTGGDRGQKSRDEEGRDEESPAGAARAGARASARGICVPARPIPSGSAGAARAPSAPSPPQTSGGNPAPGGSETGAPVQDQAPLDDAGPALAPPHPLLPLGIPPLDGALGGGLALGALHEAAARGPGAEGALTAFALALAARAAFQLKRPVLMVQHELAELEAGSLYAPGLVELGLCDGALVLVRVHKAQDVLFAMEEGLKCGGLAAVLGEVGTAFPEPLTATRRLSLAARAHPVLGLLLRQRPDGAACAALTRWAIAPAASTPRDSYGGLGLPTLEAALTRNRLGPLGRWTLCLAGPAFLSAAPSPALPRQAREAGS